jgi:hypothetical protein
MIGQRSPRRKLLDRYDLIAKQQAGNNFPVLDPKIGVVGAERSDAPVRGCRGVAALRPSHPWSAPVKKASYSQPVPKLVPCVDQTEARKGPGPHSRRSDLRPVRAVVLTSVTAVPYAPRQPKARSVAAPSRYYSEFQVRLAAENDCTPSVLRVVGTSGTR